MSTRIILVTGSKGGGGKTPIALALALAHEELGFNVLTLDLNFNNADLSSIFMGTNLAYRAINGWDKVQEDKKIPYWKITERLQVLSWDRTKKLGLPSTSELWDYLSMVVKEFISDPEDNNVIIGDTNLTLPLLCPPLTKLQDWESLPPIEVWHVWSPSIVLQVHEQERVIEAISVLKRFSPGFEYRLHHVFTPRFHISNKLGSNLRTWAQGKFEVSKKYNLKPTLPLKPISFEDIRKSLFATYLIEIFNQEPGRRDPNWLMKTWMEHLIEELAQKPFYPSNVLIISTVLAKISLFVEQLILKTEKTINDLIQELDILYETVKNTVLMDLNRAPSKNGTTNILAVTPEE